MRRRIPLWLTLVPLVVGIGVYYGYWVQQRDAFRAVAARALGTDRISMRGFPYRIEGEIVPLAVAREGGGAALALSADRLVINRQPWGQSLVVGHFANPQLSVAAPAVAGAKLHVGAKDARASLRWENARIARLSAVFTTAQVQVGLVPVAAAAESFELHVRETPTAANHTGRTPTDQQQAQLVLEAAGVRFAGGDPLSVSADFGVAARAPVRDVSQWLVGGTLELRRLTLADATSEILSASATASPDRAGRLLIAGTLATVCPRSIAALFAGQPAPTEYRARRARRFAFRGRPGAIDLLIPAASLTRIAERRMDPPCPKLRG